MTISNCNLKGGKSGYFSPPKMLEFQVELIAPKNAAAPERAIAAALVADASDADFNLLNLTCSK